MSPPEDRAVSEVIGAVLLFGFLVVAFSVYQGVVIPQQNRAAEFEHNLEVQDAIQDLRNAIRQTATTGSEESVSATLGATYPLRVLGMNPGVSAGSLRTVTLGNVTIRNATATDPEVADYVGTSTTTLGPFASEALVYRPVYTHYTEAPTTTYENTLAYNSFPSGANLSVTEQAVVDGRKLTIVVLDGDLAEAEQGTVTVDTQAVSTATTAISVRNDSGPLNLTLPTRLSAANWTDLLEDEFVDQGGHVTAVTSTGPNQVSLLLEPSSDYELRLAKVGVGAGASEAPAKYLVDVEGDETSVVEGGTQHLVVQANDRFTNPVSNVSVTAAPSDGSIDGATTKKTDARGRATFVYNASGVAGTKDVDVDVSFDGDGTSNETVRFDVKVLDAAGGGGGGGSTDDGTSSINPSASEKTITYVNTTAFSNNTVHLRLNNTNDTAIDITELRFQFYSPAATGQARETPAEMDFGGDRVGYLDSFTDVSETVQPGVHVVELEFFEADGNTYDVREGDFLILTVVTDEGDTITYFVGVTTP